MTTAAFWKAAFERAVKSFAQAVLAVFGAGVFNVLNADWENALSIGAGAAVLSLLTSVVSAGVGPTGSPSLVTDPAAAGVQPPA